MLYKIVQNWVLVEYLSSIFSYLSYSLYPLFLLPWFCNMYDAFILFFVRIVLTPPICWFAINVNGKCFQVHEWFGSLDGAVGIWINILWMINTQQLIFKYESWVFLVYIFAYNSWHMVMVLLFLNIKIVSSYRYQGPLHCIRISYMSILS